MQPLYKADLENLGKVFFKKGWFLVRVQVHRSVNEAVSNKK